MRGAPLTPASPTLSPRAGRGFLRLLWHWLSRWPLIGGVAVLFLSILSFDGLGLLGMPDLFWRLSAGVSFSAGLGVALVFAVLSYSGYLLESEDLLRLGLLGYWRRTYPALLLIFAVGLWRERHQHALAMFLGWLTGFVLIAVFTLVFFRLARRIAWRTRHSRARRFLLPRARGSALHLHVYAAFVGAVTTLVYILMSTVRPLYEWVVAPFAIAVMLAILVLVYGWILFRYPRQRFVILGVLLIWIALANVVPYRYRFPSLDYSRPYDFTPRKVTLVPDELEAWRTNLAKLEPGVKPKLIVVTTSGGGIRAAAWTSAVLSKLAHCSPIANFPYHVRLIAGASGGMVGAADFVTRLPPPGVAGARTCAASTIASDALDPVARALALRDVPKLFLPLHFADRGVALEQAWIDNSPPMGKPLGDLAAGEAAGWCPSLVFTPMFAEDGRRLIVSNLDCSRLTVAADPHSGRVYSRRAVELLRIAPDARSMPVATAARMNASFPFVSPASEGPFRPRRHIVDAGYYDNYGVATAAAWIAQHAPWIGKNTSGVVLIQIRDEALQHTLLDVRQPGDSPLTNHFGELAVPVVAMINAGLQMPVFRNDEDVEQLGRMFEPGFFATFVFENANPEPLSWTLTKAQRDAINRGFDAQHDAAALVHWWTRQ
ncbi:MAG TPA: hypothetical protein VJ276_24390 [Thermoanaerobaculia bacterium]|nr:hypothetical protein [Thermoanaerobaculia bacterium]